MASDRAQTTTNVAPRLVEMTPFQVYLQQVRGAADAIRAKAAGFTYVPPQFGGLSGQLQTVTGEIVLELIDFSVSDGSK